MLKVRVPPSLNCSYECTGLPAPVDCSIPATQWGAGEGGIDFF